MINKRYPHKKHWTDTKRYLHIGIPPTQEEKRRWIIQKVQNPQFISSYSFMPLIHRVISTPRYRKKYKQGSETRREYKAKKREICYSCHLDSIIYRYYAEFIQGKYEEILDKNPFLSKAVVAYRQLPVDESKPEKGNKCNIEFAQDAFQFIKDSSESELFVGVYDITNFFNSLDHELLKLSWITVCGFKHRLPKDHYTVFKNATMYSYVKETDIFNLFKDNIICHKSKTSKQIVKRRISKIRYLYNNDKLPIAFCEKEGIKEIKRKKLIYDNKYIDESRNIRRKIGIPQGLPISAVLANIYMLIFDELIVEYLISIGGFYRRYSDDIIIICKKEYRDIIKEFLHSFITALKLEIQPEKEKEYILNKQKDGSFICKEMNYPFRNKIEYLGFEFDGKRVLLKSASLSGFYSRMNKAVERSKYYSKTINNRHRGIIFKNQLFSRFSSYGSMRKKIYRQYKDSSGKIVNIYIGKKSWGNYISYVNRASLVMKEPAIKRQLKRHLPILRKKII